MKQKIAFICIFLLQACAQPPAYQSTAILVGIDAEGKCTASIKGQAVNLEALTEDQLRVLFPDKREVKFVGTNDVPYRCIGGSIYTMQKAGYRKVGFISGTEKSE